MAARAGSEGRKQYQRPFRKPAWQPPAGFFLRLSNEVSRGRSTPRMKTETGAPPSRLAVTTAFAAVYIVWGATYLAIRMGVATLPPFLMAAARFLVAGALLLGWTWLRGATLPTARQWRNSAITGSLLLLGGNGLVCWAEQTVNSSLAALIIAASPMWFALFEWARPGGRRPTAITSLGLIAGFSGVGLLVLGTPHGSGSAASTSVAGVLALVVACAAWAGGSIFSKHSDNPESHLGSPQPLKCSPAAPRCSGCRC
jgi:drug/metabolite transporter (DMT)-like permease